MRVPPRHGDDATDGPVAARSARRTTGHAEPDDGGGVIHTQCHIRTKCLPERRTDRS